MKTFTSEFGPGDKVKLSYPHEIKKLVLSFPDMEMVTITCPGVIEAAIYQVNFSDDHTSHFRTPLYMYAANQKCSCGERRWGNCFPENDEHIVR